jgi:ATP-dependent Clp protease ATP-binding subunit ClpA
MFERYTEKARRVIFFARYEASNFGSPYIETEHLLLGLMRENRLLMNRFLSSQAVESIHKRIEEHTTVRDKIPTSVDLPLSHESKRVLAFCAEDAQRLGHKHIGPEHMLIGLLREEKCFAATILHEHGLRLATIREELGGKPWEEATSTEGASSAGRPGAISIVPQAFNLPVEMHAEITGQAQARGIEVQAHLLSLLERALHPRPAQADTGVTPGERVERYRLLRRRMEAEGFPCLNAAELSEEIARRKGMRP